MLMSKIEFLVENHRAMKVTSDDTATKDRCSSCGGFVELCDGCAIVMSSPKRRTKLVTHPPGSGLQIIGAKKPLLPKAKPQH